MKIINRLVNTARSIGYIIIGLTTALLMTNYYDLTILCNDVVFVESTATKN